MPVHIIPVDKLSPEALRGVIEEFISRNGTDYYIQLTSLASPQVAAADGECARYRIQSDIFPTRIPKVDLCPLSLKLEMDRMVNGCPLFTF